MRLAVWAGAALGSAFMFAAPDVAAQAAKTSDKTPTEITILYLERRTPPPPVLSNLDPIPADLGLAGAKLAIADSNTTGRFLGQTYRLEELVLEEQADLAAAVADQLESVDLIVAKAPAADLATLADLPAASNALILNAGAADDALRTKDCRANLLHTLPSRAMRADALAQFLVKKRWSNLFLIEGPRAEDKAFAAALRRSAKKFNLKIAVDKPWPFAADMRRNAAQEVPAFTQAGDYDVLLVADQYRDFSRYVAYNMWDPRPLAGDEGLTPVAWSRTVEQWGAAQLQSRFRKLAGRPMQSKDYAAWAAVRSIAEAVTRAKKTDAASIRAYLLSDTFQLAAFKGRKLSFRAWNGQLRQPIPLVHPGALVALAPLDGFLHPKTELDTLGFDRRASGCAAFN